MRAGWAAYVVGALVALVALSEIAARRADLNHDEGWYLYAARQVNAGRVPYQDFFFTQPPVMPHVYAYFDDVVREHGLLGARRITAGLALVAVIIGGVLAARLAPPGCGTAAFVWALLLGVSSLFQIQYSAVVKTYSLTSLFLVLGLLAFIEGQLRERAVWLGFAAVFLAAATATRLSAGAAILVLLLSLGACPPRFRARAVLVFLPMLAVALGILILPALRAHPDGFMEGVVRFHAARDAGGAGDLLLFKAGFIARTLQNYLLLILLGLGAWLVRLVLAWRHSPAPAVTRNPGFLPVLAAVGAVTAVHLAAPFPYDDYQVFLFPAAVALVGAGLARVSAYWVHQMTGRKNYEPVEILLPARFQRAATGLLAAGALIALGGSPLWADWFVYGRDTIWWLRKPESPVASLQAAARDLAAISDPASPVLTQDLYLAVEANRSVPRGWELGPFSVFPDLDAERADRLRVLSPAHLDRILDNPAVTAAAISGYTLAIAAPTVTPFPAERREAWLNALEARFEPVGDPRHPFGQAHTTLQLYRRRGSAPAAEPAPPPEPPPEPEPEPGPEPDPGAEGPEPEGDPPPEDAPEADG